MRGITEAFVRKNRKVSTDTVRLLFQADITTFHNLKHQSIAG